MKFVSKAPSFAYMPPEVRAYRPGSKLIRFKAWLLVAGLGASGCGPKNNSETNAMSASAASSVGAPASASGSATAPAASANPGGRGDGSGGGEKAKRFGEASAYVDGKPLGVLRIHEMPGNLPTQTQKLEDGRIVPRYHMAEYIASLGVDLKKVKQLHIHGGRNRVSIMDGSELLKYEKTLKFSYSRGDSGKARMEWPDAPIKINTTVDTIVAIAVYVDKTPPTYDREKRALFDDAGLRIEGIPFAKPEESLRGTRVYSDGKLLASVKRKKLPDSVLADSYTATNHRFSLSKYVSSLGVDATKVKHVFALRGDFVVKRFDAADWKTGANSAEFSMAQGAEGRMLLHLPGDMDRGRPTSAIVIFQDNLPPKRILAAPPEELETGSDVDQPKPE